MATQNPGDLRRWERQTAAIPVSLVLEAENFRSDPSATTINVSLFGVGVRTKLALVPGEWVGIVPKGEFPHAIPSRVAWVREDESSSWTVAGLSFLNTLEV
jgi:hypothetical protein